MVDGGSSEGLKSRSGESLSTAIMIMFTRMINVNRLGCCFAVMAVAALHIFPRHALAQAVPHPVSLSDLQRVSLLDTTIQLSPDGRYIVYARGGEIWLVLTKQPASPAKIADGFLPIWSPSGNRLAFYSARDDGIQLYVMDISRRQVTRVTEVEGGIDPDPTTSLVSPIDWAFRYSWSPDGSHIVFASRIPVDTPDSSASDALSEVDQMRSSSSGPLILTRSTPDYWTLSSIFKHDDIGGRGVFESKDGYNTTIKPVGRPDVALANQLFIVDIATQKLRRLTRGNGTYFSPDWSPDGKAIACAVSGQTRSMLGVTNIQIALIEVTSGKLSVITASAAIRRRPTWSPNGHAIAYLGNERFYSQTSIYVGDVKTKKFVNIAYNLDRQIEDYVWSPDSDSLLISYRDGVSHPIAHVAISSWAIAPLFVVPSIVPTFNSRITVSETGAIAWEQSEPLHPGVIMLLTRDSSAAKVIVDLYPETKSWLTGEIEVIRWKNHRGDDMEGVLLFPLGYERGRKYPMIVDTYPLATGFLWTAPMGGNLAWATAGYAVFRPNPRAPHAYINHWKSSESALAGKGANGWDVTYDDVISGVDEIVKRGVADPNRMCLYGFSNGGGVVNDLVTRTDRFKCAVSVSGVLPDWISEALLWTGSWDVLSEWVGKSLFESPDDYVRLSPVFRLNRVSTPMLLAAGDDEQFLLGVVEMYNGLRHAGADVTFLRYPGQGHGFTGQALEDFWARELAFFGKYLEVASKK